jgi:hypothetical protein
VEADSWKAQLLKAFLEMPEQISRRNRTATGRSEDQAFLGQPISQSVDYKFRYRHRAPGLIGLRLAKREMTADLNLGAPDLQDFLVQADDLRRIADSRLRQAQTARRSR